MTTAPFDDAVAQLVAQSHEQTFRAEAVNGATVVPLDVEDGYLEWDENRAPRVTGQLDVTIPDEASLALVDPRQFVRVRCYAGYRLPDGTHDEHLVADLGLRTRTVDRPDDRVTLSLASDEALVIDRGEGWHRMGQFTYEVPNGPTGILWMIDNALAYGPAELPVINPPVVITHTQNTPIDELPNAQDDWWQGIVALADYIDADVYDDGLRVWHIAPRSTLTPAAHTLTVGANGTIERSSSRIDRDDWANTVALIYEWTDGLGDDHRIVGLATVTAGPYMPETAGFRAYATTRRIQTTQNRATVAAGHVLAKMLSRARGYSLDAVAAWWVRAGDTVTVQLPTGAEERHIVTRVRFTPTDQTMTVQTRLPDGLSTITTGE